ncbi:hypothetical protein ACTQ49_11405 [Luteococcus sp. Sow4_B9]|uniref:hypothetical protein n=1 Tax=Luteococcus sp. Sow4_B9 TaxID=3438792 RepID=UPI003F991B78
MTGQDTDPMSTATFVEDFEGRARRIGRILLGSWSAGDTLARQVRVDLEPAAHEDHTPVELLSLGFRAVVKAAFALDSPPDELLPAWSLQDPPAVRLGHALSALPIRKRLAIVLAHQENLSTLRLADAMGITPDAAERLLSAAEGHLEAILQARGDDIEFEPKAHRAR